MSEDTNKKAELEEKIEAVAVESAQPAPVAEKAAAAPTRDTRGDRFDRKRNVRRGAREARVKPEFDQKIINVRRVARVAAGGRRFRFSVAMVIGNRRGGVGVGTGKGADTAVAIDKAMRDAKKNLLQVKLTPEMSIPHRVEAKYSSARIMLMPAPGRGVVAGSAVRTVIELAGIKDVTSKVFSPSKNSLNTARATVEALSRIRNLNRVKKAPVNKEK